LQRVAHFLNRRIEIVAHAGVGGRQFVADAYGHVLGGDPGEASADGAHDEVLFGFGVLAGVGHVLPMRVDGGVDGVGGDVERAVQTLGADVAEMDAAADRVEARRRFAHKSVAAVDGVVDRVLSRRAGPVFVDADDARLEVALGDSQTDGFDGVERGERFSRRTARAKARKAGEPGEREHPDVLGQRNLAAAGGDRGRGDGRDEQQPEPATPEAVRA